MHLYLLSDLVSTDDKIRAHHLSAFLRARVLEDLDDVTGRVHTSISSPSFAALYHCVDELATTTRLFACSSRPVLAVAQATIHGSLAGVLLEVPHERWACPTRLAPVLPADAEAPLAARMCTLSAAEYAYHAPGRSCAHTRYSRKPPKFVVYQVVLSTHRQHGLPLVIFLVANQLADGESGK